MTKFRWAPKSFLRQPCKIQTFPSLPTWSKVDFMQIKRPQTQSYMKPSLTKFLVLHLLLRFCKKFVILVVPLLFLSAILGPESSDFPIRDRARSSNCLILRISGSLSGWGSLFWKSNLDKMVTLRKFHLHSSRFSFFSFFFWCLENSRKKSKLVHFGGKTFLFTYSLLKVNQPNFDQIGSRKMNSTVKYGLCFRIGSTFFDFLVQLPGIYMDFLFCNNSIARAQASFRFNHSSTQHGLIWESWFNGLAMNLGTKWHSNHGIHCHQCLFWNNWARSVLHCLPLRRQHLIKRRGNFVILMPGSCLRISREFSRRWRKFRFRFKDKTGASDFAYQNWMVLT